MSDVSLETLSHKRLAYLCLYIGGALLLVVAAAFWWSRTSVEPERVFWKTINNSLSTNGVTLTVNESTATASDKQSIQYSLGSTNQVHAVRTVTQGTTVVKTESVGTADKTYTRYTAIEGSQNKDLKLDGVLGVWSNPIPDNSKSSPQLLPQVALGLALPLGAVPVPIGIIPNEARDTLVHLMRTRALYQVDYQTVKRERKDGKLYYTYDVAMQPALYLSVMKSFAATAGLHDFENVDPSQYAGGANIKLKLTIDAHGRQLTAVDSEEQGYHESYSGYGVETHVDMPKQVISLQELQKRLTEIK